MNRSNGERRVLVVEDDADVRGMIASVLRDEGLDVLTAPDGYQALRILASGRPDAIVLDFGLPLLDGPTLLESWRGREAADRQIPIIGMSGLPNGRALARRCGVNDFFPKPLDLEELVATVLRQT